MKTVLICTEASYLATGYATYSMEILKRLHATGKYNLVEFAAYGDKNDPRANTPWNFFQVLPENEQEGQVYNSSPAHQFGGYKFEKALLQYKPNVVYAFTDPWMCNYQIYSPFRRFYNLFWMPTVDSSPQPEEWVWEYEQCDGIFTYTKWGENQLRAASNKIKHLGQASPAADYQIFRPVINKSQHKQTVGLPDGFVIGTAMRNQKRKLIPNLIKVFDRICEEGVIKNPILYLHTTWPDMGWNLPELIKTSKNAHRIYFTYMCQCGSVYPSVFCDSVAPCKSCGQFSAIMPSTQNGLARKTLAGIYNLFDVYVQYVNSEGFGMPVAEAAACCIPTFGTNYSSLESVIPDCGGQTIDCLLQLEADKQTHVAIPNDDDFIYKLYKYYKSDAVEKERKQKQARASTMKNYDYDRTVSNLMKAFDASPDIKWDTKADLRQPNPPAPQTTPYKLVEWAFANILGRPEWAGSYYHSKFARYLINQNKFLGFGGPALNEMSALGLRSPNAPYGPNDFLNEMANMRNSWNEWEQKRVGS